MLAGLAGPHLLEPDPHIDIDLLGRLLIGQTRRLGVCSDTVHLLDTARQLRRCEVERGGVGKRALHIVRLIEDEHVLFEVNVERFPRFGIDQIVIWNKEHVRGLLQLAHVVEGAELRVGRRAFTWDGHMASAHATCAVLESVEGAHGGVKRARSGGYGYDMEEILARYGRDMGELRATCAVLDSDTKSSMSGTSAPVVGRLSFCLHSFNCR